MGDSPLRLRLIDNLALLAGKEDLRDKRDAPLAVRLMEERNNTGIRQGSK